MSAAVSNLLSPSDLIKITQAEYDLLSYEEKHNGKAYFITDGAGSSGLAEDIAYDNTDSGMQATDVQGAIDELESTKVTGPDLTLSINNGILRVSWDDGQ